MSVERQMQSVSAHIMSLERKLITVSRARPTRTENDSAPLEHAVGNVIVRADVRARRAERVGEARVGQVVRHGREELRQTAPLKAREL